MQWILHTVPNTRENISSSLDFKGRRFSWDGIHLELKLLRVLVFPTKMQETASRESSSVSSRTSIAVGLLWKYEPAWNSSLRAEGAMCNILQCMFSSEDGWLEIVIYMVEFKYTRLCFVEGFG